MIMEFIYSPLIVPSLQLYESFNMLEDLVNNSSVIVCSCACILRYFCLPLRDKFCVT